MCTYDAQPSSNRGKKTFLCVELNRILGDGTTESNLFWFELGKDEFKTQH